MMFLLLIRLRSTEYYNNYQGVRYVPYCPAAGVVPHSLFTGRTYVEYWKRKEDSQDVVAMEYAIDHSQATDLATRSVNHFSLRNDYPISCAIAHPLAHCHREIM